MKYAIRIPANNSLERDLPELLTFFDFPRHLWRKLRTTNAIERCFVEVRRRTRPMVCFVNVERGPYPLCHLATLQSTREKPHPPPALTGKKLQKAETIGETATAGFCGPIHLVFPARLSHCWDARSTTLGTSDSSRYLERTKSCAAVRILFR